MRTEPCVVERNAKSTLSPDGSRSRRLSPNEGRMQQRLTTIRQNARFQNGNKLKTQKKKQDWARQATSTRIEGGPLSSDHAIGPSVWQRAMVFLGQNSCVFNRESIRNNEKWKKKEGVYSVLNVWMDGISIAGPNVLLLSTSYTYVWLIRCISLPFQYLNFVWSF